MTLFVDSTTAACVPFNGPGSIAPTRSGTLQVNNRRHDTGKVLNLMSFASCELGPVPKSAPKRNSKQFKSSVSQATHMSLKHTQRSQQLLLTL